MTLRYRSFIGESRDFIERFISSIREDRELARHAAAVMLAHVKSLDSLGLIPRESFNRVAEILKRVVKSEGEDLYKWIEENNLQFEDVFEALEAYLYRETGEHAGYIALGRSRNDHVATTLRLVARDYLIEILSRLLELRENLIRKSLEYRDTLFLFFTHQQLAQCGSAAQYFISYSHTMSVLSDLFFRSLDLLNENPLGSGAAAGSLIDLDRELIARNLCLNNAVIPPYYATGSRLFLIYLLSLITLLLAELSRFAEDMIFINSLTPESLRPSEEHIATSSIMPHKRNLVTMELVRAKSSKIIGFLAGALSTYSSIPYGYNLDLQELNRLFIDSVREAIEIIKIISDFIHSLRIDREAVERFIDRKPCWSSEVVEYISLRDKKPAREIYFYVARIIGDLASSESHATLDKILSSTDLNTLIKSKPVERYIERLLEEHKSCLERDKTRLESVIERVNNCFKELIS